MLEKGVGLAIDVGAIIYLCIVVFVVSHFIIKFW